MLNETHLTGSTEIDLSKLPEDSGIKNVINEIIGDDDTTFQARFWLCREQGSISVKELLEHLLSWNGIIGFNHMIMGWFEEMQNARK